MSVEVIGLNSLDADLQAFQVKIAAAVASALTEVGEEMKTSLAAHIESDVYKAYTPKVYQRRSQNPALGTPLNDMDANVHIYEKGAGLTLDYSPTGEHESSEWYSADGTELVRRIETGAGYDYDFSKPRPFWSNFTTEMIEGGGMADAFMRGMAEIGFPLEDFATAERDGNDGEL